MTLNRRTVLARLPAALAIPSLATLPGLLPGLSHAALAGSVSARARALGQLHTLLVTRDGETLLAEAPRGSIDRAANVKSVSKTLLALLTGIAIDRGILEGPDQPVLPLLGRQPFGDARDELTLGHLLSMTAGLESTSGPNYGAWVASSDWLDFALTRELIAEPGGRFIYSTGSSHILGAALSRASGMSLLEMAREWLGGPLGIEVPIWIQDGQGRYLGGNEMALSPRALARIGQMVLASGIYNGVQVVSPDWIDTSWRPRARSPWSGDAYGYGWFLTQFAGREARYGRGYGGQLLIVVPEAGLSIAILSDPTRPARSGGYFNDLRQLVDLTVSEFA